MNPLRTMSAILQRDLLGAAWLRWDRLRLERKISRIKASARPGSPPPLACGPRLKELIGRHYLRGRVANDLGPVAWVTSGAPVEFLYALGYFVHYPENHGAVCGIRRTAQVAIQHAENAGWSQDICSYARTDFGTMLSGQGPVGALPRPDLLLCCTNICQTVLAWYRVLADHFGAELVLVDTPFLYAEASPHEITYVQRQIESAISVAERVARRDLDPARLRAVTARAAEGVDLWMRILETARHRPCPITALDAFIHLAPIVEMRGEPDTVDYYRTLLRELEQRVDRGIGAVPGEKTRLIWDNLPIWARMRWLGEYFQRQGVAVVASTYTQAWGELRSLIDPDHPIESSARLYLHPILNQGTGHKLRVLQRMIAEYSAQGVLLHSDRSCKPYSVGQLKQAERLSLDPGVPALVIEADHNDPRAFAEEQVQTRLDAFLEIIESARTSRENSP